MFELLEVLLLSVVQGIGEFLPISSSGHNAVTVHLFERFGKPLTENSADFIKLNVLLHVGTLVAVLVVFRRRILDLFGKDARLIPLLIAGTIPAVVVGLAVKKYADWIGNDLWVTAPCFAVTGILLLFSLKYSKGEKNCSEMSYADALLIGLFQAVAILPGVSRSGSTIVAGLLRNLRRDEAATFSFLLAIPVIAGGGVLEMKDLLDPTTKSGSLPTVLLFAGMLVSCGVGILTLTWLLDWLRKGKLWYFALWVFLMCPITFALAAMPLPKRNEIPDENAVVVETSPTDSKEQPLPENEKDATRSETERKPVVDIETKTDDETKPKKETPDRSKTDKPESQDKAEPVDEVKPTDEVKAPEKAETSDKEDVEMKTPEDSLSRTIEETESDRLNLSPEEARRRYEAILKEEEAKELALIEEERTRKPLVDKPDDLIPLDPKDRIWITPDGKSVVFLARITQRDEDQLMELFGCRIGTKEHESVVSVRVKPFLIHAALLAVGAEPGKPVQYDPVFVPPSGDEIEIMIRWDDDEGERKESLAQDWIVDNAVSTKTEKKSMSTHWVFTGSMIYKDLEGNDHYVADESGELIGLSNFVGSILDVPIRSSESNNDLLFSCFTERIPDLDTPLTIILTPVKNKKR